MHTILDPEVNEVGPTLVVSLRFKLHEITIVLCMYTEANILAKRAPSTGMRGRQLT